MIAKLTKDCPREDCQIEYLGSSTTLLGWSQTYDKHGNPQGRDPNTDTSSYVCHKCGVSWRVRTGGWLDKDEIERFEPKPAINSAV